jgi:hypothetical protein
MTQKNIEKYKKALQEYIADKNMPLIEIARKYGFDKRGFKKYLLQNNIPIHNVRCKKEYYDNHDKILKIFDENPNLTTTAIAKLVGVSERTAALVLKKMRNHKSIHSKKEQKRYKIDDKFFDVIDTEEKAYWLGFIMADGCIRKIKYTYMLTIELNSIDEEHLIKFKKSIKTDAPITKRKNRNMSIIRICNNHLVQQLIKKGCISNKTIDGYIPLNILTDKLFIAAYLRGYCDGDGFIDKKRYRIVYTIKSKQITDQISILLDMLNISFKVKKEKTYYRLMCERKDIFFKFLTEVYINAHIYLDRKYIIAKERYSRSGSTTTEDSE